MLNAALAPLLQQAQPGLLARPEVRDRASNRIPDIRVHRTGRPTGDSKVYWRIIECKIGTRSPQKKAAAAQARTWVEDAYCEAALSCCYPTELAEAEDNAAALAATNNLQYAIITRGDTEPEWCIGSVADLAHACFEAPVTGGARIAKILELGIHQWHHGMVPKQRKSLAKRLGTYRPCIDPNNKKARKKTEKSIANGTAIAGLILANMAMLQQRLADPSHANSRLPELRSLGDLLTDWSQRRTGLIPNLQSDWESIASIDYDPIVRPALEVLQYVRHASNEAAMQHLIQAAEEAVPLLTRDQLDYAGPIYHGLLESRYDGSFYTGTASAVLLADLAIPHDWCSDWSDWREIAAKRICDPACGTGTLLMAAQRVLMQRFHRAHHHPRATTQEQSNVQHQARRLQRELIEKSLIGLDINPQAIQLAACMLTMGAGHQEYSEMRLHRMQHGNAKDRTRAGSLELLIGEEQELEELDLDKAGAQQGPQAELPKTAGEIAPPGTIDLVIMNPPYTRNAIRNDHLTAEDERDVQNRELRIAAKSDAKYHDCIDNSSVETYFTPIADRITKAENGIFATVTPYTTNTGSAATNKRKLLQQQYHIKYIITGHDNSNIAFSGNTSIHESLIIGRRRDDTNQTEPTHFISLTRNPDSTLEAENLADAIREATRGDLAKLERYGTIHAVPADTMAQAATWPWAAFVNQTLADEYQEHLQQHPALVPIGDIADLGPDPRQLSGNFQPQPKSTNAHKHPYFALWDHKTNDQRTLATAPNCRLLPNSKKIRHCNHLWSKRSPLLLGKRWEPRNVRTVAAFATPAPLASAFLCTTPKQDDHNHSKAKAYAVYFNSTVGVLALLNSRGRKLTYPMFSLEALRTLPAPSQSCDLSPLTAAYEKHKDAELLPLPELHRDPIRIQFDDAVAQVLPHLAEHLPRWRQRIAAEPTVHGRKHDEPHPQPLQI